MVLCVYCGVAEGVTQDHVPPACLFPSPKPALVTVPACEPCNGGFKNDDHYFQVAMCVESAYFDKEATKIWKEKVIPGLNWDPAIVHPRRDPLRKKLLRNARKAVVSTSTGLILGDRIAIPFDADRIRRSVTRIVRGLLWHHYERRLLPASRVTVKFKPEPEAIVEVMKVLAYGRIGNVFHYRHGIAVDDPETSVWILQFYVSSQFLVFIDGPSVTEEKLDAVDM